MTTIIARAFTLLFGLATATAAFIHATAESSPGWLYTANVQIAGLTANAITSRVDQLFRIEVSKNQSVQEVRIPHLSEQLSTLARTAFAEDPLEASTLRTIALGSLLHEDMGSARQLMRNAAKISKRDDITNLWLAQDYGRLGDLNAMIRSFDRALRTSTRTREAVLTPILNMLGREDIYATLGKLLDQRPEWEADFWSRFVRNPVAVMHSAEFLASTAISLDRIPIEERGVLYTNLKQTGQFDTLQRLAELDPLANAGKAELESGGLVTADDGYPLAWSTYSRGNFAARVTRNSGVLEIEASPGSFGVAADRVIQLYGNHRLVIALADPVPDNATVEVAVVCIADGQQLASLAIGPRDRAGETTFSVPNCDFATLQLSFHVDTGRRDALIRVARIQLAASGDVW